MAVYLMAKITEDSIVEVRVKGPTDTTGTSNSVRSGGSISYRIYDENYPFEASLPDATCT